MAKKARDAKPESLSSEPLADPPSVHVEPDAPPAEAPAPTDPADILSAQLRASGMSELVIAQQLVALGMSVTAAPIPRNLLVGEFVRRLGGGPVATAFAVIEISRNGHRRQSEANWQESYDSFCKEQR